jgi:hypothetical protein
MKTKLAVFVFVAFALVASIVPQRAWADSIYLTWGTTGPLAVGSTVAVTLNFQPSTNETVVGWGQALQYDPSELTFQSYTLGNNVLGLVGTDDLMDPANPSYTWIARYDWSFRGVSVNAGAVYQLFTAYYTFNGGLQDGTDVSILNRPASQVPDIYMETGKGGWTDTTGIHVAGGPDFYSATAAPIPGAALLLGSGLAGLVGMGKKKLFRGLKGNA